MEIINKHFASLRDHAALVSSGVKSELATALVFDNKSDADIKFSELIHKQFKELERSLDLNINTLLNLCTSDALEKIKDVHHGVIWDCPKDDTCTMLLVGITKLKTGNQPWVFDFVDSATGATQYTCYLSELFWEDKMGLLEAVELCM